MSTDIKSGASTNLATVCTTCRSIFTTPYNSGEYNSFLGNTSDSYKTIYMDLGGSMVAGDCFFSLTAGATALYVQKLLLMSGFTSGTPASTYTDISMSRATGTPAGGSGTFTTTGLAARVPGTSMTNNGTVRYGPTIITGLTDDSAGDIASFMVQHQTGAINNTDFIEIFNSTKLFSTDYLNLPANNSLALRVRSNSVAGTIVCINIAWTT